MKTRTFAILLLLSAAFSVNFDSRSIAQEASSEKRMEISEVEAADANGDGTVTTEELKAFLNESYLEAWAQKIDANQNGKISKWEFRLARKALEQLFAEEGRAAVAKKVANNRKQPTTAVEAMNARFFGQKPLIGSTVKDLIAFDEDGEEVNFKTFRGKHVVVVFGCLT